MRIYVALALSIATFGFASWAQNAAPAQAPAPVAAPTVAPAATAPAPVAPAPAAVAAPVAAPVPPKPTLPVLWSSMNSSRSIQVDRAEVANNILTLWFSRPTATIATSNSDYYTLHQIEYMTADYSKYSNLRIGGPAFASSTDLYPNQKAWIKYPAPPGNPPTITLTLNHHDLLEIPVTYK